MGKKSGVQIVVIVEDQRLEQFARQALKALGFDRNKIRVEPDYPRQGKGSGKQYVDRKCQSEIVILRRYGGNRALLLGTEADEQTVAQRRQMLDSQANPHREPSERIVYWIPKWHVETWGLHLTGSTVDENTDYHTQGSSIDWKTAGKIFKEEYHAHKQGVLSALQSLNDAYQETGRL